MSDRIDTSTTSARPGPETMASGVSTGEISGKSERAEFDKELEEIGLTRQAPWISAIILFGSGGLTALIVGTLWPSIVPAGIRLLAAIAIAMALFSVYGLKRLLHVGWAAHIRILVGIAIIFTGAQISGDVALAMGILLIFPLISPAYLYLPRVSVPYMLLGAAALVGSLLRPGAEQWNTAHTIVTTAVLVTIVGSLIFSQARVRMLIRMHKNRAFSDPLTGLANTRRLEESTLGELDRLRQTDQPVALFAIDLDNFKQVNDMFDHRTGDQVLIAVADALRAHTEIQDVAARRGGDEFSVLVPAAGDRDLDELGEQMRKAIVAARKRVCEQVTPTASVGYAMAQQDDDFESLLARADDELHTHKRMFHAGETGSRRSHGTVVDIARKRANAGDFAREPGRPSKRLLQLGGERWFVVSYLAVEIALLVAGVAAAGLAGPLSALEGALVGAGMLSLAGLSWALVRVGRGSGAAHLMFLLLIGLITTAVLFAGPAGSSLLDLYMLVGLMSFFVLEPRAAAVWFVVSLGAAIVIALAGHFPNAGARVGSMIAIAAVVAGLFAKIRSLTLKYMEQNVELSNRDPLTGLANMRALGERLRERLDAAPAGRVAMIVVDLDDFKQVNDTISHSFGDNLLREVAVAIEDVTDSGDRVARRGGDEFYVVCASDDDCDVKATAKRVGDAITNARLAICPNLNPSATVATVVSEPGDDARALLYHADVALHAAKLQSREVRGRQFGNVS